MIVAAPDRNSLTTNRQATRENERDLLRKSNTSFKTLETFICSAINALYDQLELNKLLLSYCYNNISLLDSNDLITSLHFGKTTVRITNTTRPYFDKDDKAEVLAPIAYVAI